MTDAPILFGTLETEVELKASAEKFYQMYAGKPNDISNVTPEKMQGCYLHQGEWGQVGSIVSWNYVLDGEATVAKEMVEAVDLEKNLITFRVVEGDPMKEYTSFLTTIQVTPKHGGSGSVVHWHFEYEKINEEVADPENLLQLVVEVSNDIDEHLLAKE